ncbi:hypothetical protein [Denitromonas ohlonensis]|uniref:Phage abortive infection protein n=2 Tax=Denitromonas TaxID=139331 RepID=A0A557SB60_9RHOO|nr:hypothetical protein [Denitromonas ohlonensis]TVO68361.1 hypothetical protein FHP90_03510 [Denitromonas ohlonensis]TVO74639.1 hypothetical protein FHP89_15060 [Denitromonas ohlonensis]
MRTHTKDQPDWITENLPRVLKVLGLAAAILATVTVGLYMWFFRSLSITSEPDAWGQLGDFFGGVLNPAFSFLALLALLMTLYVQSRELKLSRQVAELSKEELELTRGELKNSADALSAQNEAIHDQRFEQTFFAWLESYRSLVGDIHFDLSRYGPLSVGEIRIRNGREALKTMHSQFLAGCHVLETGWSQGVIPVPLQGDWIKQIRALPTEHHDAFRSIYMSLREDFFRKGFRNDLRAPLATLEALLAWIDSQIHFSNERKRFYFSLVSSHLSWIEGYFLFMACLGDEWPELRRLTNQSGILEKFDWHTDPCVQIVRPLLDSVFIRPPKWPGKTL